MGYIDGEELLKNKGLHPVEVFICSFFRID